MTPAQNKKYTKKYYLKYPWMRSFYGARLRCTCSKGSVSYKTYGARGIRFILTVAEIKRLWFRDKAFLMKRPSIDRVKNDGHYEFKNCRFIELSENIGNRNKIYRKQGGPGRCNSRAAY
jgi:hypothetical protein